MTVIGKHYPIGLNEAITKVYNTRFYGYEKYEKENPELWKTQTVEEHLAHAEMHLRDFLTMNKFNPNNSEQVIELSHLACRALMALQIKIEQVYTENTEMNLLFKKSKGESYKQLKWYLESESLEEE